MQLKDTRELASWQYPRSTRTSTVYILCTIPTDEATARGRTAQRQCLIAPRVGFRVAAIALVRVRRTGEGEQIHPAVFCY